MAFRLRWSQEARRQYDDLERAASAAKDNRLKAGRGTQGKTEGLFKQVRKTVRLLAEDPRHPGLHTHEYSSLTNPYRDSEKVFEAYVQNKTPGAFRLFWCYGPGKGDITIVTITRHP